MINIFTIIIIFALLLEFVLATVANALNLKSLRTDMPPTLEEVYKPEEYRNSQKYNRSRIRFGFVTSTFSLCLILSFWFAGGFNYLDQFVRTWGFPHIVNGLIYMGILGISYSLLMIPFSVYATFVIEERFGFNRTTPRIFIMDILKGLILAVILGAPLLAGILALFEYAGSYAWLYCWVAVSVFVIFLNFIAPVWIMPLFSKFTPMQAGELKDSILKYARSVGYDISNVFVMDGSKRSTKSSAFFTGFGRTKRVALFDTLIEKQMVPEVVAILAHEIGHFKKRHIQQAMVISVLHLGFIFFLLSVVVGSPGLYQAFYMEQQPLYAGLVFFGLLYTPIELLLSIVLLAVSRKNEYMADRFAAQTTGEPGSVVDALKKLYANNLSNLTPHPFYVWLNYSHPTLLQRVGAIKQYKNG